MEKYDCKEIKIKPYYRIDGILRKKVKGYTKKVYILKKDPETKREVSPEKKYGHWYK